ncbi:hypothetical protein GQX74_010164 [Glossina fuscipes]|nr:hypothetical protein GQX74_010164 [Glossina fuscipes]
MHRRQVAGCNGCVTITPWIIIVLLLGNIYQNAHVFRIPAHTLGIHRLHKHVLRTWYLPVECVTVTIQHPKILIRVTQNLNFQSSSQSVHHHVGFTFNVLDTIS